MTIPTIGGLDPAFLEGIPQLAANLARLARPNAEFQQQARMLFLQKPELMQKFVDVEKENPGTLKAMGFGDPGSDLLSGMKESIPGLIQRNVGPEIEDLLVKDGGLRKKIARKTVTGQTTAEEADEDLGQWMSGTFLKVFKENKDLAMRMLRAKTGIGSVLENDQEDRTRELINNTPEHLLKRDPNLVFDDFLTGKLGSGELAGYLLRPESQGFKAAMNLYQMEREGAIRSEIARSGQTQDNIEYRMKYGQAYDAWKAAKGRGTVAAWYKRIHGTAEAGSVNPNDEKEVGEALKDQQLSAFLQQKIKLRTSIDPHIKGVQDATDDTIRKYHVDAMNTVLTEDGSPWRAEWNTSRGALGKFASNKLMFRNGDKVTDDPTVIFSAVEPTNIETEPGVTLNPQQKALADDLVTKTGEERKQAIAAIRQRGIAAGMQRETEEIIRQGGGDR